MAFSTHNVLSFREAHCDNDHYLVTAEVREGWMVSKKAVEKLGVERFNLKKLNELEVRKQYQMKVSKRFAASQNLNYSKDIKQGLGTH